MKGKIIFLVFVVILAVFLSKSALVIDKGTEGQYTGVVAFDAQASSGSDWEKIVAEITGNAKEVKDLNLSSLGAGVAIKVKGTVSDYISQANGRKNSLVIVPEGYTGGMKFTVQLGSIYSGTAVRDIQTVKSCGDFTNQTEWSQYAKALNSQLDKSTVAPLALDVNVKGRTVSIIGAATSSGSNVTITPVAISIAD